MSLQIIICLTLPLTSTKLKVELVINKLQSMYDDVFNFMFIIITSLGTMLHHYITSLGILLLCVGPLHSTQYQQDPSSTK